MVCPRQSASVASRLALAREVVRLCFRRCSERTRVSSTWEAGSGSNNDDVIEVGDIAFKIFDDHVDDLNDPPWRGTDSLGHDEPFEESGGCAEHGEGVVSLSMAI